MRLSAALSWMAVIGAVLLSEPALLTTPCGIEMRNVALHVAEGVVLDVRTLDGEFIIHSKTDPPIFDDPNSYTLRLRTADLAMDGPSLTTLLQQGLATKK